MNRKILVDEHATLNVANGQIGKSYRPSNGTEGEVFCEAFCFRCRKNNKGCRIKIMTMALDANDPNYPKEWVYAEDGQPICTAFV